MPDHKTLDERLYSLSPEESKFYKLQTGIDNDNDLRDHILSVQAKAYDIYPYPCIRIFSFTKIRIAHQIDYDHVLKLGREREGAILLDIGCCFGNDARKAVSDGYPVENIIASDLRQEFWDLGHVLFKSTAETFPVPFIAGDVFDPNHLTSAPYYVEPPTAAPHLKSLTSLTPLQGHTSAIYASSFFHLFSEVQQFQLAQALASLLSPLPGSIIFGSHIGDMEPNVRAPGKFSHSPDSWRKLWDGGVFKKGTVRVEARLKDITEQYAMAKCFLFWSVIRL